MAEDTNWDYKQEHTPGTVISPDPTSQKAQLTPTPQPSVQQPAVPDTPDIEFSINWSASEFIAHQKNSGWYFMFFVGVGAVTGLIFLATKDIFTSALIALVGVAMGIFGSRKPRSINYAIDEQGVTVGQKFYGWELFKSFALVEEGAIDSIYLTPLKRFMPAISMYFEPKDGQKILDILSSFLPQEERTRDFVENLMHKIRF